MMQIIVRRIYTLGFGVLLVRPSLQKGTPDRQQTPGRNASLQIKLKFYKKILPTYQTFFCICGGQRLKIYSVPSKNIYNSDVKPSPVKYLLNTAPSINSPLRHSRTALPR